MLRRLRELIPNPARRHLIPYNTTSLERDVAVSLGIPMYGADPRLADLGSKTGCRRMFEQLGVRCPVGAEDLATVDDLVRALVEMRQRRPTLKEAIVKMNEGVSGSGNALVDLRGLPASGDPGEDAAVRERVLGMAPEKTSMAVDAYLAAFEKGGGIAEERITGAALTSPSVQMRAAPDGPVELLSTHDQLLGGASGQSYLGCVFPADPAYATLIAEPAMVVGRHLAALGVIGRFAVDFVTVRDDAAAGRRTPSSLTSARAAPPTPSSRCSSSPAASTTARRALRDPARTREAPGRDRPLRGRPALKALTLDDLFDAVATSGLHFDASVQTGVVLHMISCITECGRLGITAVGDSAEHAWEVYEEAQRVLLEEARRARREGPVIA